MKTINDKEINNTDKEKKVLKGPFYFLYGKNSFLKEKSRGLIWLLKMEVIIILICFLISLIFNNIQDKTKFILKYEIENKFYNASASLNSENYDYSIITSSINKNTKLSKEEKEFIQANIKNEIEENFDYIDIKKVAKRLDGLETRYCKKYVYNKNYNLYELKYPNYTNSGIAGRYNDFFNMIYLYEDIENVPENYESLIYDFNSSNKKAYFHEINHLLAENNNFKKNVILEGVNELFTREYYLFEENNVEKNDYNFENREKTIDGYEKIMPYIYVLAELVDTETLREYKFNSRESILISALLKIDDNIDEAYKLIDGINSINMYERMDNETVRKIREGYTYFYSKKYGKDIKEDLEILAYFYDTPIQTEEERETLIKFLELEENDKIIKIVPKGYVSKQFVHYYQNLEIIYTKNGNKTSIELID